MKRFIGILALLVHTGVSAQYMPWDTIGIATGADLDIPVPLDGERRSWRAWGQDGSHSWGWIEAERTGDWRAWDNERGWRWGRVEIED